MGHMIGQGFPFIDCGDSWEVWPSSEEDVCSVYAQGHFACDHRGLVIFVPYMRVY